MTQLSDAHTIGFEYQLEVPKQCLRVAIVGCGIGHAHARGYASLPDHFELRTICDIDQGKAEAFAEQHKIAEHQLARIETDFEQLLVREDLDVIDICTPPHLHVPMVKRVLEAGKHVICEKPMAASIAEVDGLIILENASSSRVMPIFQYRFGHGFQKLEWLKTHGLFGRAHVSTVETHWRRREEYYAPEWRGRWATELGGGLLGHAIHAHDMLYSVLGPAKSVYARIATRVNEIEVEDCASVTLEMGDGSLASLSMTLGSVDEISRHRFCFANLVVESNMRPYTSSGDPWRFIGDTPERQSQIDAALEQFVPEPEGYAGQFLRFHRALEHDTALPVTLQDARASLELVTAMYRSGRSGQAVGLPIGSDARDYTGWLPESHWES